MKCKDCPYYYPTESGFTSCQWMPRCPDDIPPCEEEDECVYDPYNDPDYTEEEM